MNFAINSDAISNDFFTAVTLGLEWGIDIFELKRINNKRIPEINDDEIKYIKSTLKEKNVKICGLSPGLFKCSLDKSDLEIELKKFYKSIDLAQDLKVNKLIIFGFNIDHSLKFIDVKNQIIDIFGDITNYAASYGIELCIENDRGQWTEDPKNLIEIIDEINSKSLNLNWDPANLIGLNYGNDFERHYHNLNRYISYVHMKDGTVNSDGNSIVNCMVGDGIVDWKKQFELLLVDEYNGPVVIEPHFGCRISSSRTHIQKAKQLFRNAYHKTITK